jgi:hypothetical protein
MISHIITRSWQEGKLPEDWRKATIIPVPKVNQSTNPSDYRPISLTCIISKIAERFVLNQISDAINSKLPWQQFGFRQGKGTADALIEAEYNIIEAMEKCQGTKSRVAVVSYDIHKAFDTVSHFLLLQILRSNFSLSLNARRWIGAFLTDRSQRVQVKQSFSSWSTISSGVPQGTVLGPILYNAFTSSMKDLKLSPDSRIVLYADDLLLIKPLPSIKEENELQADCDCIANFFSSHHLKVNGSKTKLLLVSISPTGPEAVANPLVLNGSKVPQVSSIKYLGIHFDDRLSFISHNTSTAKKARQMLGAIANVLNRWRMKDQMTKIYLTCIRPVLSYGSAITMGKTSDGDSILERVNKSAARVILNEYSTPVYEDLLLKLGWDSVKKTSIVEQMRIMFKHVQQIHSEDYEIENCPLHWITTESSRRSSRLSHSLCCCVSGLQPRLARTGSTAVHLMVKRWNALPKATVLSPSLPCFINATHNFLTPVKLSQM